MRDHLIVYVNGTRRAVRGCDAFLSLSDYLRQRLGLIGTKIVCSEGDCGACTTLIGRPADSTLSLHYLPVDSCIQFMFQLDGAHVVSVEGLRPPGELNAVQRAMIDCHGSQCGFCTPGFVMAMTGMLESCDHLDEPQLRAGLTGNLCRCTGYTPILDAGMKAVEAEHARLNELYPAAPILADFAVHAGDAVRLETESYGEQLTAACPATLNEAIAFLAAHPTATIIAGATDVGVRVNKSHRRPPTILDLNRVSELDYVHAEDGELRIGARATWTAVLAALRSPHPSTRRARGGISTTAINGIRAKGAAPLNQPLPTVESSLHNEFARILSVFGAPQIRHVGTIAGNIANASPIADSLPLLLVMEASLLLVSAAGRRELNINEFYHGYKQIDLQPGELIAEIRLPLPADEELLRLYKVTCRRDLDISSFTAAVRMRLDGETIEAASVAMGAVGPVVLRLPRTESFLSGRPLTEATMCAAGDVAVGEITPIDDVRGSADYRRTLARNVLVKFYHQSQAESAANV